MAKWGEGDPRWIVEEREDAKNVNNWHWTEKNATAWSQKKIKELLTDLKVENDQFSCSISEVSKCEGDATANNRKAKLIFFYEWLIECKWVGQKKNSSNKSKFEGKVEVNNLSDENTADELDVVITCDSSSDDAHACKQFMHLQGSKLIKERLAVYIVELKEEYGKNLILPSKNQTQKENKPSPPAPSKEAVKTCQSVMKVADVKLSDGKLQDITINDEFFCAPDDLYRVFTSKELVCAFTRASAEIDARVNGPFSLWGGNVSGTFKELIPSKKIVMDWRKSDWEPNFSTRVTMEFESFDRGTKLKLTQRGVPEPLGENIKNGWHSNYFLAIKQIFGYGNGIF